MITILKIEDGDLKGWIMAPDIEGARHKARGAFQRELFDILSEIEAPPPGKTVLSNGCIMLVDAVPTR